MKQMITLYADSGMILKDGDTFGTTMQLADGKTADGITEITLDEYEEIMSKEEPETM
jgi:hypothetical protein